MVDPEMPELRDIDRVVRMINIRVANAVRLDFAWDNG